MMPVKAAGRGVDYRGAMPATVHELDVRPLLAAGQSPLAAILAATEALPATGALRLRAPFEPLPLYGKLGALGLDAAPTNEPDGSWTILFTPKTTTLDLRDLEPPEPLQRTIEAATALPRHGILVTRTRFRPVHLLAALGERGFATTSVEQPDGSWENTIRPAGPRP